MLSGVTVETEKSCIRDQKARVQLQFRPTSTLSSHVSIAFVALSRKFHRVIDDAAELSFYPLSPALIIFFSSFLFNHGGKKRRRRRRSCEGKKGEYEKKQNQEKSPGGGTTKLSRKKEKNEEDENMEHKRLRVL